MNVYYIYAKITAFYPGACFNCGRIGVSSSPVDTTANAFSTKTSSTFKLSGGQKTYTLQVKSSEGVSLYIQSARLRVNF